MNANTKTTDTVYSSGPLRLRGKPDPRSVAAAKVLLDAIARFQATQGGIVEFVRPRVLYKRHEECWRKAQRMEQAGGPAIRVMYFEQPNHRMLASSVPAIPWILIDKVYVEQAIAFHPELIVHVLSALSRTREEVAAEQAKRPAPPEASPLIASATAGIGIVA